MLVAVLVVGAIGTPVAFGHPHTGWNPAPTGYVVGPNPDQQGAEPTVTPSAHASTSARIVRSNPDQQLPQATTSSPGGLTEPNSSHSSMRASAPSSSQGFQFDDAAIGAGVIAGLALIGMAGVFTVRRRGQLQHP
jgi:hypothetical protein